MEQQRLIRYNGELTHCFYAGAAMRRQISLSRQEDS